MHPSKSSVPKVAEPRGEPHRSKEPFGVMEEPFRGVEEPRPSIFGQERVREDQTTRIPRARAAARVRERTPNLRRMLATWRLTV